jgi:hypothetical protein
MNKKALAIIGVLVFIIGAELFYYSSLTNTRQGNTVIATTPLTAQEKKGIASRVENLTQTSMVTSALLNLQLKGEIVDFKLGKATSTEGYQYYLSISLRNENGKVGIFQFSEEEVSRIQARQSLKNGGFRKLQLQDLKVGDAIICEEIIDLSKPSSDNLVSATISKLN